MPRVAKQTKDEERMMIDTDTLLVKCPQCGAWPMAANFFSGPNLAQPVLRFRCARCRHDEGGRLRRAGIVQRPSGNRAYQPAAHGAR
jgi:hypothetical protein